ncbi:MAG TPA: hypothetical protein VG455_11360, partial [Acidimicrobiales bacterium]|nr:hypothetical protein [Acidimicrobiales bacterium]
GGPLVIAVGLSLGADEKPGNPDVYRRIEATTDCAVLQAEFELAMDHAERRQPGDPLRKVSLAYAKAADERLGEVGCYRAG